MRSTGFALAALTLGAVVGLAGCGTDGDGTSARPSDRASATRSVSPPTASADRQTGAANTPTAEATRDGGVLPTRPDRTTAPAQVPTGGAPPATTQPAPAQPAQPPPRTATNPTGPPPTTGALSPAQTATASAAAAPTAGSTGLGVGGWIVLIGLAAALVAGPLIWHSRRRSAWDAELGALESDTRAATSVRLPPVLSTETAAQRSLTWPALRADLMSLVDRWGALAERAPGEERIARARLIQRLLQDVVEAVDAENDGLVAGRDLTLLRPRVDAAEQALTAALATSQPQAAPVTRQP